MFSKHLPIREVFLSGGYKKRWTNWAVGWAVGGGRSEWAVGQACHGTHYFPGSPMQLPTTYFGTVSTNIVVSNALLYVFEKFLPAILQPTSDSFTSFIAPSVESP